MIITMTPNTASDPALIEAITTWRPRGPLPPSVDLESHPRGLRVKLTYLGVESGVLFDWGGWGSPEAVQRTLDRLFEVLSWRVISPPSLSAGRGVWSRSLG
jgi:hypothetical protein